MSTPIRHPALAAYTLASRRPHLLPPCSPTTITTRLAQMLSRKPPPSHQDYTFRSFRLQQPCNQLPTPRPLSFPAFAYTHCQGCRAARRPARSFLLPSTPVSVVFRFSYGNLIRFPRRKCPSEPPAPGLPCCRAACPPGAPAACPWTRRPPAMRPSAQGHAPAPRRRPPRATGHGWTRARCVGLRGMLLEQWLWVLWHALTLHRVYNRKQPCTTGHPDTLTPSPSRSARSTTWWPTPAPWET